MWADVPEPASVEGNPPQAECRPNGHPKIKSGDDTLLLAMDVWRCKVIYAVVPDLQTELATRWKKNAYGYGKRTMGDIVSSYTTVEVRQHNGPRLIRKIC